MFLLIGGSAGFEPVPIGRSGMSSRAVRVSGQGKPHPTMHPIHKFVRKAKLLFGRVGGYRVLTTMNDMIDLNPTNISEIF
jgi:hypothetical protein